MKPSLPGWFRPRASRESLKFDSILALVLALSATTTSLLYARSGIYPELAQTWVWVTGLALVTLPLALRRVWPVPVALVVTAGFFICGQFAVPELLITNIGLFIALYTVGAWEARRVLAFWTRFGVSCAMVIWLIVVLIFASSDTETMPDVSRSGLFSAFATYAVIQIITNLMYFGGAFYFGDRSWQAARLRTQLEAQGRELEGERRISAEQAVSLDRMSIARELHDVVAHHVSVMGIQAAAARRLLAQVDGAQAAGRQRDGTQIDQVPLADAQTTASLSRAAQALEVVEASAEQTIAELRGLLATLRAPETTSAATTLGIAQLPALVQASITAGVPTTLIVAGSPRPVPQLVDVALYRTAQEALTNVRKHAGRGAEATVRLRFETAAVELEVGDTGITQRLGRGHGLAGAAVSGGSRTADVSGGSGAHGAGLGLRGMRERVGAVGGTVDSHRRESGGFLVRARIPLTSLQQGSAGDTLDPADNTAPAAVPYTSATPDRPRDAASSATSAAKPTGPALSAALSAASAPTAPEAPSRKDHS